MPKEWRGVNLHPLRQKGLLAKFFYLFWHAWSIDLLMLFHFSYGTLLLGLTYKLLHPSGILYVKADGLAILAQEEQLCRSNNWKVKILCYLFKRLLERVDKISIETEDDYKRLCKDVYKRQQQDYDWIEQHGIYARKEYETRYDYKISLNEFRSFMRKI